MSRECATILISGRRLFKKLGRKRRRKSSRIKHFKTMHNIEILETESLLENAVDLIDRACLILVDLSGRITSEVAWDVGFICGTGKKKVLLGLQGKKKHPGKIVDTFGHIFPDRAFYSAVIDCEKTWDWLGKTVDRCWQGCGGNREILFEDLQGPINEMEDRVKRIWRFVDIGGFVE